jgi:hypothetical protein
MEPRKPDKSVDPEGGSQSSPPRPPERKRRFQIVKLEERVAPRLGTSYFGCHGGPTLNKKCV